MSDTTGKCMEIKVGQYPKNYRMVQHVELTDECIERIADAVVKKMLAAEPEIIRCKDCKWERCHINVDKHGNSEIYWWCLNWDGGTEADGFCHEAERRNDG